MFSTSFCDLLPIYIRVSTEASANTLYVRTMSVRLNLLSINSRHLDILMFLSQELGTINELYPYSLTRETAFSMKQT